MSGTGDNPFGTGPFGRFDWARYQLLDLVPPEYLSQDRDYGGQLQAFLESLVPSFDYIVEKISKYDDLRDPLKSPVEESFLRPIRIIQVDALGDGTSRVFISQGSDGSVFDGLRPGQVLVDSSKTRFTIIQINSADLPDNVDSPPIDPFTGNPSGKNIIVSNIATSNQETLPLVSGKTFSADDVTPSPLDNGSNVGPYTFTVSYAPIAGNLVTVQWKESGVDKFGFFQKSGQYFGQLSYGSSINFTTGVVVVRPANDIAIDSGSLKISYTTQQIYQENPTPTPADNGTNLGPYVFTATYTPLAAHVTKLTWMEGATTMTGQFSSAGVPSGSLHASSTINFTTGVISAQTASGLAITSDTLRVSYLSATVLPPEDGKVVAQNILAILAKDYGIDIDRRDPEVYQRSYVYNAYQLWDLKGTADGYKTMGALAGYEVKASNLYRITNDVAAGLPADRLYPQAGYIMEDENPGFDADSTISPMEDGSVVGPFTIQLARIPIYADADIVMTWTEDGTSRTVVLQSDDSLSGSDELLLSAFTANRTTGVLTATFVATHGPDADSIRITYTPVQYYTDLAPKRPLFDEVIADAIPLDLYCFDDDYPAIEQSVTVSTVTFMESVGSNSRWSVVVTTAASYLSLGTEGLLTDSAAVEHIVENFSRLTSTTYSFDVVGNISPALGSAVVRWSALRNSPEEITDILDTTYGATITPNPDSSSLGPFTIQLSRFPIDSSPVDLMWEEGGPDRFATISGTSTVSGTNAADIASASLNRTTGVLTLTFAVGNPPDPGIRVTYVALADLNIVGIGTDLTALGTQYFGYSGVRYRLRHTFHDPVAVADPGNWKIIDANGVQSWIEKVTLISSSPYVYDFEFVSGSVPATGPANIFYSCFVSPDCTYCAASAVRLSVKADDVLNYPDALAEGATDRLVARLEQMLPAHVRFAEFDVFEETIEEAAGASAGVAAASAIAASGVSGWETMTAAPVAFGHGVQSILLNSGEVLVFGEFNRSYIQNGSVSGSSYLYDPAADTWAASGTLITPKRCLGGVIKLADGKVLAAGGYHDLPVDESFCEIYDPVAETWTATGSCVHTRWDKGMFLIQLGNGLVLGVSQCDSNMAAIDASSELYDPVAGTWDDAVDITSFGINEINGVVKLASGDVFMMGHDSFSTGNAIVYDPGTNTWSAVAPHPLAGNTILRSAAIVMLPSGNVMSVHRSGGVYIYDPGADSWSVAASLSDAGTNVTSPVLVTTSTGVFRAGGVIYPGYTTAATVTEEYDEGTDTWTLLDPRNETNLPQISNAIEIGTGILLGDGAILVIGGIKLSPANNLGTTTVERFNP